MSKGSVSGSTVWVADETGMVNTYCNSSGWGLSCPKGYSPRDRTFEQAVPCNGPSGLGCCCNEWVMGMFGNFNLGTSSDMFQTLPHIGWCECSRCIPHAVASDPVHVAFVYECTDPVTTYGANQSCQKIGGCANSCGCDNVSILRNWRPPSPYRFFHPSCCAESMAM